MKIQSPLVVVVHIAASFLLLPLLATGCGVPEGEDASFETTTAALSCASYTSQETESAPVQVVGPKTLPTGWNSTPWQKPTVSTSTTPFKGRAGRPATHEGIDYINNNTAAPIVDVKAAAAGTVVYVRLGCPQSTVFAANQTLRECGAGWGNHVVVSHGNSLYTRYAHLDPADVVVTVDQVVTLGQRLAGMGNSGRSDLRHLHFEFGKKTTAFDSCITAQSMTNVWDPAVLFP
jgi:murein DD-endopeptidase MepM/ murein hydrolase activator NlpD